MSSVYVVAITCVNVKKVKQPNKLLVYTFQVTWSDESTTTKELTTEDLQTFRKHLKTQVYNNRPEIPIPEVPDIQVGGAFTSKARKAERRRKSAEEYCTKLINLPHHAGKLQAIATQFTASNDVVNLSLTGTSESNLDKPGTSVPNWGKESVSSRTANGKLQPEEPEKPKRRSREPEYAQVVRTVGRADDSKLKYVEVEIIQKELREAREKKEPVYAEIAFMRFSTGFDWLSSTATDDDTDEDQTAAAPRSPDASPSSSPSALSPLSNSPSKRLSDSHNEQASSPPFPHPPPPSVPVVEPEVVEKTEVEDPEPAHIMSDVDESTPKVAPRINAESVNKKQPIFDAAMMAYFPSRTIIALPPSHPPDPCPPSNDIKLKKREIPKDVVNVYVVAICNWNRKAENTLSFKRKQRGILVYTTDTWWFISTGSALGWVPGDHWRIVTDSRTISGKPTTHLSPWYWGVLDRAECEALLKKGNNTDFLVRESANSTGHLVLSLKKNDECIDHFGIYTSDQGSYYIGQHHFKTIHNVILYYKKKMLFGEANGTEYRLGRLVVKSTK